MKLHYGYRANKVLYDFLLCNHIKGTFLLPANICDSVPITFQEAGCNIRFVDINAASLCIDENDVINQIQDCTGILSVHTYGVQDSFDPFFARVRCKKKDAIIIDDRCLCWPDFEEDGLYDNSIADLTLFSLGNKKQVQLGEGGIGVLNDKWECTGVKDINISTDTIFENKAFSFNIMKYLLQKDITKEHISRLQMIYSENLPLDIQLPMKYNNWRFNIRVNTFRKEQILRMLFEHKLYASSHYKSLAENAEKNTPNAVKFQKEIINLFIDPKYYTEDQALETCRLINSIF